MNAGTILLRELAAETSEGERAALAGGMKTLKEPGVAGNTGRDSSAGDDGRLFGVTRRKFGPMGAMGGTILASLAAGFVGSVIAHAFLGSMGDFGFGGSVTSEQSGDGGTADTSGDDSGSGEYGGGYYSGDDFGGSGF
jgi:hypothetical protein